ncbi:site-specific integrase [Viridibacillus sp. FSL H7-0596]|uniref:tyrosine-type recombinase/integrase n=1 Tax=Viridibacillus sp. FSL H7-0596 TaxID=1928923 RepID=UPI001FEFDA5F|nr:site-specific integrase [Viridibacillus sp. FSL H7-0596]
MDYAIKHGYIQNNPFKLVDMPNGRKKLKADEEEHENFYTKEQLIKFLKCMEQEQNYKAFALFQLLAYSGMRKGEALALNWKDINFKTNEIRINKAISRGKNNRLYGKDTKTGDSRVIKMDVRSMSILAEWKKLQKKEYFSIGISTTQPKQLVFSNEDNNYLQPTKTRKWLEHVLNKHKFPKITTHGFRHTHCSLLLEAGVSIKEVQDRLGHSDIQTTMNIYAHVSKQAKEEAINKFDSFMSI